MSGVSGFMDFVRANLENSETILCPCSDCLNLVRHNVQDVERHLNCRGMCMTYTRWIFHGEAFSDDESPNGDHGAYQSDNDEDFEDANDNDINYVDDASDMIDDLQKSGHQGSSKPNLYASLLEEAKVELHEGCTTFTRLAFIIKLLHVKSYTRMTNRGFDLLLEVLRAALPKVKFPKSYADAKSVLSEVGLGYQTIHVCKYDCALYWGDHEKNTHCPVCGVSRWKDPDGKKDSSQGA